MEKRIGVPESACRIVLAHNPDTADTRFSARVDLMLSGHTHGGQFDLPFVGTAMLPVRNRTYSSGLKVSPKGTRVSSSRASDGQSCRGDSPASQRSPYCSSYWNPEEEGETLWSVRFDDPP